ncbi:ABC transporter substrate-binding protein [Intrasporangium calvum]|uniref:ABC transporter substrate-binding protein n=1 Tax=Intrasporangium calvum TaxID=53358 RepID=A0ABT5GDK9_9MICO|nr:ABC transporter substrate-binding protein [Intrasporangium calvum]MDC5696304.1 ABC transporter substrate-binding protein [Intrasporangium calvum]
MTRKSVRVAVALAASLGVMATAACGGGSAPAAGSAGNGKAELTVWHYWDGNNGDTFASMAKTFEGSHPNTTLKLVNVPGSDLLTKLQAAAQSRTLPDIVIGDLVTVPRMAKTGQAVDLKPLVGENTWSDIYPEMLKFGSQDGKQISIPVSSNTLAWMFNKTDFTKAGLDPANPPQTWDELKAASAKIRQATGKPGFELFTTPGTDGEGVTWNFQVSLWQAGGEFLNQDNTKAAFNSEAGKKALQFWVDLVKAKDSPLAPWGEFEKGKAASAQEGSWMAGIWKPKPPFDFGVAQIPHPADGQPATNMGGEQAVVFTQDKVEQKAAGEFLTWFVDPAQNTSWSEKTGFLPVRKSVAESAEYKDFVKNTLPELQPFVDALPTAKARPATPLYPQVSLAFAKQVEEALHGKAVDQALADAETQVNAILSGK